MPSPFPSSKKARVLNTFLSHPLLPKEVIAEHCGLSVAVVYRIIRAYKCRKPYRIFKHGNSAVHRKFKAENTDYRKYLK